MENAQNTTIETTVPNSKWSIIVSSDLHFGEDPRNSVIRRVKLNHLDQILRIKDTHNVKMVISAGDLTSHGTAGESGCLCWKPYGGDELTELREQWVDPIERTGIKLLMCPGNHDTYTGTLKHPVLKYLCRRRNAPFHPFLKTYRSGRYTYEYNGVLFISLGMYPGPSNVKFLKSVLSENSDTPVIIFYHYNTISTEKYSDWWKESEKDAFYEAIAGYNNIIAIINGHIHTSSVKKWRGFTMINGGGANMVRIEMDGDKFVKAVLHSVP